MRKIVCMLVVGLTPIVIHAQDKTDYSFYNSWLQHKEMSEKSIFSDLQWNCIGPKNIGGRIESLVSIAGNHQIMYVGAGSGSLWKTTNGGFSWKPIFDDGPTSSIGKVALAPTNSDIVWLGTGEGSGSPGVGIFKSTNGGETWEHKGLKGTKSIKGLAIHPGNPDVVYTAAVGYTNKSQERGVYKTTDGGDTWKQVLSPEGRTGINEIVMNNNDPDILYATIKRGGGSSPAVIYKTTDAGQNWERSMNGFPDDKNIRSLDIDISKSNPSVLYAAVSHTPPSEESSTERRRSRRGSRSRLDLFRTNDDGENWKKVNTHDFLEGGVMNIVVSPVDENDVYLLAVQIWHSTNGGKSFQRDKNDVFHIYPNPGTFLHLDQWDLWIDPEDPDFMLLGNDGGVFRSEDRGRNWLHMNSFPIGEFYCLVTNTEEPVEISGGNQDNSSVYGPGCIDLIDGYPDNWDYVRMDQWSGGDGFFTKRDPTHPDAFYYSSQNGHLVRKNIETLQQKGIFPKKDGKKVQSDWDTPVVISSFNPYVLYFGGNFIMKSVNRGNSWTCISPDMSKPDENKERGGTVSDLNASEIEEGLLYVGTGRGTIKITRNEGITWEDISKGLPTGRVRSIKASRFDAPVVFAAITKDFSPYAYMSQDYGSTWKNISANLPQESVNIIIEDTKDKNILYAGTMRGVYVSLDRGGCWHSVSKNLPVCSVRDMVSHAKAEMLIIATYGRGIFTADMKSIREYLQEKAAQKEAYLFDMKTARLPFNKPDRIKKATISYFTKNPKDEIRFEVHDDNSLVYTLKHDTRKGFNQFVWDMRIQKPVVDSRYYRVLGKYLSAGSYRIKMIAGETLLGEKELLVENYIGGSSESEMHWELD